MYSLIETTDGGLVLVGSMYSDDISGLILEGYIDAVIIKYDKDGNLLWQKRWGGNYNDHFNSVVETYDKNFLAVGTYNSDNIEGLPNDRDNDSVIVKFDKNGNILWQKCWGGNNSDSFAHIVSVNENGFVAIGRSDSSDIEGIDWKENTSVAVIVGYDIDGNILWQDSYVPEHYIEINSPLLTNDDGVIINVKLYDYDGEINEYTTEDAIIIKYDSRGNKEWTNVFSGNNAENFNKIFLTKDNNLLAYGWTNSTNIDDIEMDGYRKYILVKYSINYNLENNTNNENGSVIVEQQGRYGIVKPTPNEGYEVDKIIVKDKSGNVLDVEVTKQEDGTYSFELYTDVSVEVLFKEKLVNPKTGVSSFIGIIFTLMLIGISSFFMIRNCNNSYEL